MLEGRKDKYIENPGSYDKGEQFVNYRMYTGRQLRICCSIQKRLQKRQRITYFREKGTMSVSVNEILHPKIFNRT